ncbi:hypothetical protein ACC712_37875, partial [Rhizobium ruizarguesonis]
AMNFIEGRIEHGSGALVFRSKDLTVDLSGYSKSCPGAILKTARRASGIAGKQKDGASQPRSVSAEEGCLGDIEPGSHGIAGLQGDIAH